RSAHGDLTEAFARLDGCGMDTELARLAKACLAAEPDARPRNGSEVAAQVAAYRAGVAERLRTAELERAAAEVRAVEERRRRRAQGGSDELRQRVGQARDDLARVRRDQHMVAKLEEAGAQRAAPGKEGFDKEGSRQRFEEAFAWYGLDVRQGTPEKAAARVED